jgi:hypothetical protein
VVKASDATPLLFTDAGDPLLFESSGQRRMLLTAFPFDRDATDWPRHPTFVPFLDLCLQSLRREPPAPTDLAPREVGVFHLPAESQAREFILSDGTTELQRGPIAGRRLQFTAPAKPGVYVVHFDSTADTPLWLAVNPPPQESELKYNSNPAEVLGRIVQSETPREPGPQTTSTEPTRAEILRQRWWWVVLLLALATLFGENLYLALRRERS